MSNHINNNMEYYCAYLRKSRKDRELEAQGQGETLARHEKMLKDLAEKRNIKISKFYREVVSGESIATRPVMQELLADVEKGLWTGVLVVEVERLARGDTMDQGLVSQTFKYSNTKIITPLKIYDPNNDFDEQYFEFGLFMSRQEYRTINRRLHAGMIASVKEGKYISSYPPYGYEKYKLKGQKGNSLRPIPEQATIIKFIFEECLKGNSITSIKNALNLKCIPSARNSEWVQSTIRQILRNPVYIGKIKWEDRRTKKKIIDGKVIRVHNPDSEIILVDGIHEPIIDEKTFEEVQKILDSHITPNQKEKSSLNNSLAGILKCELCGKTMSMVLKYPRDKKKPALRCLYCNNSSSVYETVEKKLLDSLVVLLKEYELDYNEMNQKTQTETLLKIDQEKVNKLHDTLEKLSLQKNNLYDLLEQGVYDKETFLNRSNLINEKIDSTQKEILDLNADIEKLETVINNKRTFIPKLQNVIDTYFKTDDIVLKNKLLKSVLGKVTYKKVNPKSPEDFTLTLYPKLF